MKMPRMVATTILSDQQKWSMVYHTTEVFVLDKINNKVILDCWYDSVTTKKRINQAFYLLGLPYKLVQRKLDWFVFNLNTNEEVCKLINGNIKLEFSV